MRPVVLVMAVVVGMLGVAQVAAAPAPLAAVAGAAGTAGDAAVVADPLDFNGDGYADLAVGVPDEDDGSGVVNVIYGSEDGLSATDDPDQIWGLGSADVEGVAEAGEHFGSALAAGDFNSDYIADLAVGVRNEDAFGLADGGVNVIYGSDDGLSATATPDQFWTQDSQDVNDSAESVDFLAWAVGAADFNADGFADLAIGVPIESYQEADDGVVNVIYGAEGGLSATEVPDQLWGQAVWLVEGTANLEDHFGKAFPAPVTITSGWML